MATSSVVSAILAATSNSKVRAAMLMGSSLEGGWGPTFGVGDNGTSFGPFQIHLPAHPGVSSGEASNAAWAVSFMLPAYESGVNRVPASLWSSDPAQAAATAAYFAERPAVMYPASRYRANWTRVQSALSGNTSFLSTAASDITGGGASASASPATTTGFSLNPQTWIQDAQQALIPFVNYTIMTGIIGSGALLMVIGVILLFKGEMPTPITTVRKAFS